MTRRSRMEILIDILKAVAKGNEKPTHIMYKANLSWKRLQEQLDFLLKQDMQKNIEPIFLISLPRSGSTLLQRVLAAHNLINTTAEPWLLLPFIYATKKEGTLTKYSHSITFQGIVDLIKLLPNKIDDYNQMLAKFVSEIYESLSTPGSKYFLDKTTF